MILHHRNHHQQGLTVAGKLPRRYEKTEKKERKKERKSAFNRDVIQRGKHGEH